MKKLNKKGFTLIELIVVIAIIAVLLLILVPTMNGFVDAANQEKDLANARSIYSSAVAQQTAAKTGLKDSTGTAYTAPVTDGSLNADFWGGDIPDGCAITVAATEAITVTCNEQTYPVAD